MKIKNILLIAALFAGLSFSAQAQVKIGYASIDYILSKMPETQSMQSSLSTYEKQLSKQLETKDAYYKSKLQELSDWAQAQGITSQEDPRLATKAEELGLRKLGEDLQKAAAEAEEKLAKRQIELMTPITEKLEAKIKEVADASGYDFILNQTDSGGVSIVLYGPEDRNLTKAIMEALKIPIPAELQDGK
jgi:outer membrane protein